MFIFLVIFLCEACSFHFPNVLFVKPAVFIFLLFFYFGGLRASLLTVILFGDPKLHFLIGFLSERLQAPFPFLFSFFGSPNCFLSLFFFCEPPMFIFLVIFLCE